MSGYLATIDEALDVALEHVRWARAHRQSPTLILVALGRQLPGSRVWFDDLVATLADEWRELHSGGSLDEPQRLPPWTDPLGMS